MKNVRSFIAPDIADRVIASDDADARARGASVVALQIHNSMIFSRWVWLMVVGGIGFAIWLNSWFPVIFSAVYLAYEYFDKIVLMSRLVARGGMLVEYQAAYKRLYYRDKEFKRQVDEMLIAKKFFKVEM